VVEDGGYVNLSNPKPMPHLRVRLGGRQVVEHGGRVGHRLQPLAHRRERARDKVGRAVLPARRRRCSGGMRGAKAWGKEHAQWVQGHLAVTSQALPGQAS